MKTSNLSGSSSASAPAECIVIGGSAGSIDALINILPALPRDFALPVLVVIHLPPNERSLLAEIFGPRCQLPVKEAEDKEPLAGGTIYFAPPNYHLLVESDFTLSLSSDEPVFYSRPAIDILFETAADAYGNGLRAVVLTGASSDGAAGLRAVHRVGGLCFVQRPDTAEVSLMPQSALEACPAARSLNVQQIARELSAQAGIRPHLT
ncbi:chemotaxis protein CheB [Rariglobus hedericola]|uniref:protein-glutamate methylesterase n=1 Tax=Rariglobus hedericola TaxID=2597822 RepID=A0A556QSS5_9BACT|nr:chemotaxis protein CheB [Rariglobus hedericola]